MSHSQQRAWSTCDILFTVGTSENSSKTHFVFKLTATADLLMLKSIFWKRELLELINSTQRLRLPSWCLFICVEELPKSSFKCIDVVAYGISLANNAAKYGNSSTANTFNVKVNCKLEIGLFWHSLRSKSNNNKLFTLFRWQCTCERRTMYKDASFCSDFIVVDLKIKRNEILCTSLH